MSPHSSNKIDAEPTSLANSTIPLTPFDKVLSTAKANIMKSIDQRRRSRLFIRTWKRVGGPG